MDVINRTGNEERYPTSFSGTYEEMMGKPLSMFVAGDLWEIRDPATNKFSGEMYRMVDDDATGKGWGDY